MNESNSPKQQDHWDELVRQDDAIAHRRALAAERRHRGAAAVFNDDPSNAPGQTKTFTRSVLMRETVLITAPAQQEGELAVVDCTDAATGKPKQVCFKLDSEGDLVLARTVESR
jgi:hypothetical protein